MILKALVLLLILLCLSWAYFYKLLKQDDDKDRAVRRKRRQELINKARQDPDWQEWQTGEIVEPQTMHGRPKWKEW